MPRAVRRPRGAAVLAGVLVLGLSGCAGIGQPVPYDSRGINGLVIPTPAPDPDDFVTGVDNPWLSLEPGATRRFEVTLDGRPAGAMVVDVDAGTTAVGGLAATGVRTTAEIDGEADDVTRFYAQDAVGNVWLVGVESSAGGSWRAGEGGAEAGLAMPADPRLGDGWLTYDVPGLPRATSAVEDQSRGMVQTRETGWGDLATTTRNVYASGVGLVSVEDLDAGWQAVLVDQP